jgi:hypothetical protein
MNERDAKVQGYEVHRRDIAFIRGYVSCANCACNYSAQDMSPTFCQIYSTPIDPASTDENTLRAEACEQWCGMGMDRNKIVTPNHTYHYEKD